MAFGFLKKALGFVGKVAGVAGKVAGFVPGVGGIAGKALQLAGKGAQAVAGGKSVANTILQVRAGTPAVLQAVAAGKALVSAAVASKQSAVMPGGILAGTQTSAQKAKSISKARSKKKKAGRLTTYYRGGRKIKRRRGYGTSRRGRRGRWTRAQIRAGFAGRAAKRRAR